LDKASGIDGDEQMNIGPRLIRKDFLRCANCARKSKVNRENVITLNNLAANIDTSKY
jgi:hypothetical protein